MDKNYNKEYNNYVTTQYKTNDYQYDNTQYKNDDSTNNLRSKQYLGYTIYENGEIYNKHNEKVKSIYRGSRDMCRLYNGKGIRVVKNISRLIFSLWHEDFDSNNINIFVMIRDNKSIGEWRLEDLYLENRGFRNIKNSKTNLVDNKTRKIV